MMKEVAVARVNEEVERDSGEVEKYRRHTNGRGWVSTGARVPASTFVAEMTYIESGARVGEDSWIGPGSWVDHDVVIGNRVFIGHNVHIGQRTQIGYGARLGSHSRIGMNVRINPGAQIERDDRVADDGVVTTSSRPWPQGASPARGIGNARRETRYAA